MIRLIVQTLTVTLLFACESDLKVQTTQIASNEAKLTSSTCIDPDLSQVSSTVTLTLCNGEMAQGQLDLSNLKPENIVAGISIGNVTGEANRADLGEIFPEQILMGVTIGGVTGTLIPYDC